METVLKNEQALALVNSTLREDYRDMINKDKLAYDAIQTMRGYWNQSRKISALTLEEGQDSVLFMVKCEVLRDQLVDCGET